MSELLTQALQIAQTHKERSLRICRLASIAKLYAEAGQIEQASELFSRAIQDTQVLKYYEKSSVLCDIAIKLAAARQLDRALMVTQSIKESYSLEQVLEIIGVQLTQLEHIHEALRISLRLKKPYQRQGVLKILGAKLAELGQFDQALIIAQIPESEEDKVSILEGMIDKFSSSGQFDQAVVAANRAFRLAQAMKDSIDKSWKLLSISETLAGAGQFDQAFAVAQTINHPSVKAKTLSALATSLQVKGLSTRAIELLTQALQVVQGIEESNLREQELAGIAVKFAEIRQYNQAVKVAQTLQQEYLQSKTLQEIALKATAAGQFTLALTITQHKALRIFDKNAMLSQVVVELIKTGQSAQALPIAQALDDYSSIERLESVVLSLAKNGQYDQALQFVQNLKNNPNKKQLLEVLVHKTKYFCYVSRAKVSQLYDLLSQLTSEDLSMPDRQKSQSVPQAGVDNLFKLLKNNLRYGFREPVGKEIDPEAIVRKLMSVVDYIRNQGTVHDLRELCTQNNKLVFNDFCYVYTGRFWGLGFFGKTKDSSIYTRKLNPNSWIYKQEIDGLGDEIPIGKYFLEERISPWSGDRGMILVNKEALKQLGGEICISKRFLIEPGRQENAFKEKIHGDRNLISDLCIISSKVGEYTLNLACSLKYFSDMGGEWSSQTNEWLVGPHSGNITFFGGKIDAEFDSLIFVHGVNSKTKTIMGTPLFLLNSRTSYLWL